MDNQHISHLYNEEIDSIKNGVLAMADMMQKQLDLASQVLLKGQIELLDNIVENEIVIDGMEVALDKKFINIIATRAPTASDLRLVVAFIKIVTDLERIADESEKIANYTSELNESAKAVKHYPELKHIFREASNLVQEAIKVLNNLDSKQAMALVRQSGEFDSEMSALSRLLATLVMEDPRKMADLLVIGWCARSIDRIASHAINIAEHIVYIVKGKDIRHRAEVYKNR